jgi:hypothetical protein
VGRQSKAYSDGYDRHEGRRGCGGWATPKKSFRPGALLLVGDAVRRQGISCAPCVARLPPVPLWEGQATGPSSRARHTETWSGAVEVEAPRPLGGMGQRGVSRLPFDLLRSDGWSC